MSLKLYLGIFFFLCTSCISAQNKDYNLLKEVIDELYQESIKDKPELEKKYEESLINVDKYKKEMPDIAVFGGSAEENEQLEEIVEEVIAESMGIDPKPKKTSKKNKKKSPESISFESIKMFPDEPEGFRLLSAEELKKKPKEEIKWVEGPTVTTTHEIHLEDLPVGEQEELMAFGTHDSNTRVLNRVNFIGALHANSRDDESIKKLVAEFKQFDYDIETVFKKLKILEKDERKPYLKSQMEEIINKVIYK